jgi:putative transposase
MSFTKIWIHTVWSTKDREHYLIPGVMQFIKGESSRWINANQIIARHFKWQDDYFAASVSHSDVPNVGNYIRFQERHHRSVSWDFEIRCLLDDFGFEMFKVSFS